jgi:hypothetical protein
MPILSWGDTITLTSFRRPSPITFQSTTLATCKSIVFQPTEATSNCHTLLVSETLFLTMAGPSLGDNVITTNGIPGSPSTAKNHINHAHLGGGFDSQSSTVQFTILAFGVFLFFGLHNYLQEAIMSVPGWHFGVMLGYWEVFG